MSSYISICNIPKTLHTFLSDCLSSETSQDLVLSFLLQGLQFIHENILHNDLKCDNVVIGSTLSKQLKIYIVDFGKACLMQSCLQRI